jgi:hypothetical protein
MSLFVEMPVRAVVIAAAIASFVSFGPALAQGPATMVDAVRQFSNHACLRDAAAALEKMGFQPGQIAGVTFFVNSASADVGRSNGVDAYVKIKDQPGSVVIQHRGGCSVGGAYGSGGMKLPRRL